MGTDDRISCFGFDEFFAGWAVSKGTINSRMIAPTIDPIKSKMFTATVIERSWSVAVREPPITAPIIAITLLTTAPIWAFLPLILRSNLPAHPPESRLSKYLDSLYFDPFYLHGHWIMYWSILTTANGSSAKETQRKYPIITYAS